MRKIDILSAALLGAALLISSPARAQSAGFEPVRINCGGGPYVDGEGATWSADAHFDGGTPWFRTSGEIGGTVDDPLYLSERYGNCTYAVPVPDGTYSVGLRFAEIYWYLPGQRLFDVNVEGADVAVDLDLVAEVGGLHAFDIVTTVQVTDGFLTIDLQTRRDNAKISAIEILDAAPGTDLPRLAAAPGSLDFGLVNVSTQSSPATVTLTNTGGALLTVTDVGLRGTGAAAFSTTAASTYLIAPGESRSFVVRFAPEAVADHAAELFVTSDSDQGEAVVLLRGTGVLPSTPLLSVSPAALDFGAVRTGLSSTESLVRLDSVGTGSLEFASYSVEGPDAAAFGVAGSAPQTLATGTSTTLSVLFTPQRDGDHAATLRLASTDARGDVLVPLVGSGEALPPTEIRINAGGGAYTAADGTQWAADSGATGGTTYSNAVPVSGTPDPALYQTERYGTFSYEIPTGNGTFDVTLLFAEIYWTEAGRRVFDVQVEGITVADDLDLFATAGAKAATSITRTVDVADDVLSITLLTGIDNAKVSAIQVLQTAGGAGAGVLAASPTHADFPATVPGQSAIPATITLSNQGESELDVTEVRLEGTHALDFTTDATPPYALLPGATLTFGVTFTPQADGDRTASLRFVNSTPAGDLVVALHGVGDSFADHGFLHAVAGPAQTVTDDDQDGVETVVLNGAGSHTHQPGMSLVSWVWREAGAIVATGENPEVVLGVGPHTLELTVADGEGKTTTDTTTIDVVDPSRVPGLLALYYEGLVGAVALPDFTALVPTFGEVVAQVNVPSNATALGGVGATENVGARYVGTLTAPVDGTYAFELESDDGSALWIDGQQVIGNDGLHAMVAAQGSVQLAPGPHSIEVRYFQAGGGLGVILRWQPPGGTLEVVPPSVLAHAEVGVPPVLSSVSPASSAPQGGELLEIRGLGFFDAPVSVAIGGTVIAQDGFVAREFDRIAVLSPPGLGLVGVTVTTASGTTRSAELWYGDDVPPPVQFDISDFATITQPTSLAFGPDGRLYAASITGIITAYTLDASGAIVATQDYDAVQALGQGRVILGLAFDPTDTSSEPGLFVTNTKIFDPAQLYPGKISRLRGPLFSTLEDIVTGLPASDHDHATNGLAFGPQGELYIAQGGSTNAGVPDAAFGLRDESPLSGAVLVAHLGRPGFDGFVTYDQTINPATANQTGGQDVEVFAPGLRNPFGLVYHSNGHLYATDNGPNIGFGGQSLDCDLVGPEPEEPDDLNLIESGEYYGHPNHNRGRFDSRQCVFRAASAPVGAGYTQPVTTLPSSSDGICEYTAATFGGRLRGDLVIAQFNQVLRRYRLAPDGRSVIESEVLGPGGLDVVQGPEGSLYVADFSKDKIVRYAPVEPTPSAFTVRDTFPNRGPVAGGTTLRVTGVGFGALGSTSVTIGGAPLPLVSVSPTEIVGVLPPGAAAGAVDVVVVSAGVTRVVPGGFRYVGASTGVVGGSWAGGPDMPIEVGDTSAAAIGSDVYVLGGMNTGKAVQVFDAVRSEWRVGTSLPASFPDCDHVNVAVVDGKLYAMGGLAPASAAVHVYDPAADAWTQRGPILRNGSPFTLGAAAVAVLGTDVYLVGGLEDETLPTGVALRYDTVADTWTEIPSMPVPLNHASGVGALGKVWVIGGRPGIDQPAPGSDVVQVFDPTTGSWDASTYRLPLARAAMGPAVVVDGRLLVMGGEGGGPVSGLFPDVDELDPVTNTWRKLAPMPTPRHGTMPVVALGRVHVAGGATTEGAGLSTILEIYSPAGSTDITAPVVQLAEAPGGSYEHAPSLTLTVADDRLLEDVTYRFDDGAAFTLLSSIGEAFVLSHVFVPDDVAFHALPDGPHTLRLEGRDAAGNLGVLSWSFVKGAPPAPPVRINVGGPSLVDQLGQTWFADQGFEGGATYASPGPIAGTNDDAIYETERYGSFAYEFEVPDGRYMVHLYFAEVYGGITAPGQRVFSFACEGSVVVAELDLFGEAGSRTAVEKIFYVDVTDGFLTLTSLPLVENPKLSGIKFHPDQSGH